MVLFVPILMLMSMMKMLFGRNSNKLCQVTKGGNALAFVNK